MSIGQDSNNKKIKMKQMSLTYSSSMKYSYDKKYSNLHKSYIFDNYEIFVCHMLDAKCQCLFIELHNEERVNS